MHSATYRASTGALVSSELRVLGHEYVFRDAERADTMPGNGNQIQSHTSMRSPASDDSHCTVIASVADRHARTRNGMRVSSRLAELERSAGGYDSSAEGDARPWVCVACGYPPVTVVRRRDRGPRCRRHPPVGGREEFVPAAAADRQADNGHVSGVPRRAGPRCLTGQTRDERYHGAHRSVISPTRCCIPFVGLPDGVAVLSPAGYVSL